jgi:excisionase family DNA binding protein
MTINVKDLLTVEQAAAELNVQPVSVRRYLQTRKLTSYRIGGRRLIDPADIAAFIAAGRREAITAGSPSNGVER